MPTGTLPATHVSDVLPAADGRSSYRNLAEAQFSRVFDAEVSILMLRYTYFIKEMDNGPTPIGLHDFLQHPDDAQIQFRDVSDADFSPILIGGRYNVTEQIPVTASAEFENDYFALVLGGDYYLQPDLALGLYLTFFSVGDGDTSSVYPHVKWAVEIEGGGSLYIEGGIKINGGDGDPDSGLFFIGEYFFDRYLSAGLRFNTDYTDEITVFARYRLENGLGFSLEYGGIYDDDMLTLGAEYRF